MPRLELTTMFGIEGIQTPVLRGVGNGGNSRGVADYCAGPPSPTASRVDVRSIRRSDVDERRARALLRHRTILRS